MVPLPCSVSAGVIAVAVYGLYGAATNKWDISLKIEAHGAFDAFWETLAFIVNGIIFFYSGVACINFIVRYANLRIWGLVLGVRGPVLCPLLHAQCHVAAAFVVCQTHAYI